MASVAQSSTPPWVPVLKKQLDGHEKDQDRTTYALATLDKDGLPKVRHVIHRILTPASSILVTTTDTRMAKPAHLAKHHTVEMAWWLAEPAIQFRVTGQGYTIPADESASDYQSQMDEVLKGLRAKDDEKDKSFWEKERKRLWKEAMSGHLRASFGRPPPGTPLSQVPDPKTWPETLPAESEDAEEKKQIDNAYSHFALLAVRTTGFESLELKATPNIRTQWTEKSEGDWEEKHVSP